MTTAILGTGKLGSVIGRQLASGGETLRLSSADIQSARTLAAQIGRAAVVARVVPHLTGDARAGARQRASSR